MRLVQIFLVALVARIAIALGRADGVHIADPRRQGQGGQTVVVAANMQLNDAEAKVFWPVYDAYQADLQKINQRMGALIKNYASEYNKGAVPNETAKKLVNEMLAVEDAELKLKRSYVPKLEKVIPGMKVARYMQIENKIRAVIRYELAANIPLVQ
jgi:hypothetical protein